MTKKCRFCGAVMRETNTAVDKDGKVTEITWICPKGCNYKRRGWPKE